MYISESSAEAEYITYTTLCQRHALPAI